MLFLNGSLARPVPRFSMDRLPGTRTPWQISDRLSCVHLLAESSTAVRPARSSDPSGGLLSIPATRNTSRRRAPAGLVSEASRMRSSRAMNVTIFQAVALTRCITSQSSDHRSKGASLSGRHCFIMSSTAGLSRRRTWASTRTPGCVKRSFNRPRPGVDLWRYRAKRQGSKSRCLTVWLVYLKESAKCLE